VAVGLKPGWSLNGRIYTRQVISTDEDGIKSGDVYQYGFNLTYQPIGGTYDIYSRINFYDRGQDLFSDILFKDSGGKYVYFTPGFSKNIKGYGESAIKGWAEVDIPLKQDVNGVQLTEKVKIRFGINFGFTLFGDHGASKPGLGEHKH